MKYAFSSLDIDERRSLVVAELHRLSTGGAAPTLTDWDRLRSPSFPASTAVCRLFNVTAWKQVIATACPTLRSVKRKRAPADERGKREQRLERWIERKIADRLADLAAREEVPYPTTMQGILTAEHVTYHDLGDGTYLRRTRQYIMIR